MHSIASVAEKVAAEIACRSKTSAFVSDAAPDAAHGTAPGGNVTAKPAPGIEDGAVAAAAARIAGGEA